MATRQRKRRRRRLERRLFATKRLARDELQLIASLCVPSQALENSGCFPSLCARWESGKKEDTQGGGSLLFLGGKATASSEYDSLEKEGSGS